MTWTEMFDDDEWADAALRTEIERRVDERMDQLLAVAPFLNTAILEHLRELASCEVIFDTLEDWLLAPPALVQRARRKFRTRMRSAVKKGTTPDWQGLARYCLNEEFDRVA